MHKDDKIVWEYIDSVLLQVKNKAFRNEIEDEIFSHIQEKTDYYISLGHDNDTAEKEAVEHMGSPEKLGEEFNRLHSNKFALIIAQFCLVVFWLGLILSITNNHKYDFMVISTDGGELVKGAFVISVISFVAYAICFRLCLKNRFSKTAVNLGSVSIAAMINPFLFLPVGYSIIGALTDFPACFVSTDFLFFGGQMGWGLDEYISSPNIVYALQYVELIFTGLFFVSPLINGIFAIILSIKMRKDKNFVYKEKHFNRFSVILCVIAFLSAVAVTAEISVDDVKTYNQSIELESSAYEDYNSLKSVFDDLLIPVDKDYVHSLALSYPNKADKLLEYKSSFLTVDENVHCVVQIRDDDDDGTFETKRMYLKNKEYVTDKQIKSLGEKTTSKEIFENISNEKISDYWYSVYPGKTEESITLRRKKYNKYGDKTVVFYTFYFENGVETDRQIDTVEE